MRMRKKPNLVPRMERCSGWWIREPETMKGKWRELAPQCTRIWVEVGCGKGRFTVETAAANPDMLLIAMERVPDAMVVAMEKAREMDLKNVFFVDIDVARIEECFAPGELDGMYINFCDPWPRKKNAKRRLTHRGFLEKYSRVLREGGKIHFKTDNEPLFGFSLEEFQALSFPTEQVTWNLHEHGPVGIMTDYEEKFYQLGTPIHRCEVTLHPIAPSEKAYDSAGSGENSPKQTPEA
ncbi:MAG: tRNA (guanosine(46)-N7)-methyltransferase TrmB [Clostridiales bacterium]|nr:tRNA (guanosine(46)-N7)-methyltransferase TrmB [Clostridiales bacterium]